MNERGGGGEREKIVMDGYMLMKKKKKKKKKRSSVNGKCMHQDLLSTLEQRPDVFLLAE